MALLVIGNSYSNYDNSNFIWERVGAAVGNTFTYENPVVEPNSQIPVGGNIKDEK